MIPFENTWPYENMMGDIYFLQCPFCAEDNVILPLKKRDLDSIQTGTKKLLVLPCCRESMKVIGMDRDYFLTDRVLR